MKLSIIVATRNRAADLARLLASLHALALTERRSVEILVVDNGSSDATPQTAAAAVPAAPGIVQRYLSEPRTGKSYALNAGVRAAAGEVLAFVDDDIVVAPDWAERICDAFERDAELGGVGGRVELFNPADASITIRTSRAPAAIELAGFSPTNIPLLGCNMAFRSALCAAVGPFDPRLGPGSPTVSEDLDFLYRVLRTGARVRYLPELLVYHNHGRRTPEQLHQVRRGYVRGRGAFYYKHAREGDLQVRKWAYWEVRGCLRRMLRNPRWSELKDNLDVLAGLAKGALLFRKLPVIVD